MVYDKRAYELHNDDGSVLCQIVVTSKAKTETREEDNKEWSWSVYRWWPGRFSTERHGVVQGLAAADTIAWTTARHLLTLPTPNPQEQHYLEQLERKDVENNGD
jgi:hypothetical protein